MEFGFNNIWILVAFGVLATLMLIIIFHMFFSRKEDSPALNDIINKMNTSQAELYGRLSQFSENNTQQQTKISEAINEQKMSILKLVDEKLLEVTKNVGEGLHKSSTKTSETLNDLRERLGKIDAAQKNISSLSEQVVSLQEVLSNKQTRGLFGEIQLNDLVISSLPPSAYEFQVVLSNQKRADCVLTLPNPPGMIVIDAKFPLEGYQNLRNAETEAQKNEAARFFKATVLKHIKDISEKYIIPNETAESALMFLPSEAVFAELHANFVDVLEVSYKSKVWIVSPTTLMATLNTVRAILKDAHMKEQAGVIQKEVGVLFEDISRLDTRVESLSRHFGQAGKDIDDIKISSNKISRRIEIIENVSLGEDDLKVLENPVKVLLD